VIGKSKYSLRNCCMLSRCIEEFSTYHTRDSLVQAKTGTGKTTAFLLPAIQSLLQNSPPLGEVSMLVLSPTRELALQIAAEATRLVSKMRRPVEVHTAFGGSKRATNQNKFMNGDPKILVATPGRLNDYLRELPTQRKFISLQTLILDEADAMLEAGKEIILMFGCCFPNLTLQQVSSQIFFEFSVPSHQRTRQNGKACAFQPLSRPRSKMFSPTFSSRIILPSPL
jgi:hypothetical protein